MTDTIKTNPHAFCIKADVIGSRDSHQARLLPEIARELNQRYHETLLTPFIVRAGDEIFGILANPDSGFQAYKALYDQSRARNVPLYVGLGLGAVDLSASADSELVNGEAIWLAAEALEALKRKLRHQSNRAAAPGGRPQRIASRLGQSAPVSQFGR